ncbi:uncharacterized protein M6B38_279355 [Iris pallida]|uniref:Uncharacterized protein n=1 Tax=Iris pallida TaxID=29817 RepID=A0AAX6HYU4_IRIPA|nr:uncharacterized protein M6B38_279355 [Iris pallida]
MAEAELNAGPSTAADGTCATTTSATSHLYDGGDHLLDGGVISDMASSKSEKSDMEEKSGDNRQREDMEWLSTLSEPELDFLISLKELATRRAKNVGYKDHENKFDVRMLRGLGFILLEYVKEQIKSSTEIPDSDEMLRLLNESGLSAMNSGENSNMSSGGGTHDLDFVTPRRKRMWDGLCEGTTNCRKKLKTEVTDD